MKQCIRKNCQKEFEPNKPKQVFCSAKCRVYFSREKNAVELQDLSKPTGLEGEKKALGTKKSNFTINTAKKDIPLMPVKEDGEDSFAFAARKNDWKIKYN